MNVKLARKQGDGAFNVLAEEERRFDDVTFCDLILNLLRFDVKLVRFDVTLVRCDVKLLRKQGDGAFDFLAEEERASKHAKGTLDPGFNEQQMAVLEDTEMLVGQRDSEINNIGMYVFVCMT